ncbi:MAG: hypothetical protein R3C05_30675 [Pirellulaceae bacterium]
MLVDRRNFHLFQPLLYQVATGELSPANISAPLRALVAGTTQRANDPRRSERTRSGESQGFLRDQELPYDYLIVATVQSIIILATTSGPRSLRD